MLKHDLKREGKSEIFCCSKKMGDKNGKGGWTRKTKKRHTRHRMFWHQMSVEGVAFYLMSGAKA